jgi:hypothetical protein
MATTVTLYPHLQRLIDVLTTGLQLDYPIQAFAQLEAITIQGAPSVCLIPGEVQVLQTIPGVRKITAFRLRQEWTIVTILRDAGDQKVTVPLIALIGEWHARILRLLMQEVLTEGGPIQLLDCPASEAIDGGAIAGKLRIGTQFVLNAE